LAKFVSGTVNDSNMQKPCKSHVLTCFHLSVGCCFFSLIFGGVSPRKFLRNS
jgi:hypothetical protein